MITTYYDLNEYLYSPCGESVVVKETETVVSLDMPGVKKDDLTLQIEGNHLLISAKRGTKKIEKSYRMIHKEYDFDKISAKLEDGVLLISIPKITQPQRQKRSVTIQ